MVEILFLLVKGRGYRQSKDDRIDDQISNVDFIFRKFQPLTVKLIVRKSLMVKFVVKFQNV